jgi:hypothetical protein
MDTNYSKLFKFFSLYQREIERVLKPLRSLPYQVWDKLFTKGEEMPGVKSETKNLFHLPSGHGDPSLHSG